MELEAPGSDSISIWRLQIAYVRAIYEATDAWQIRKERVLSAGLSVQIQSDGFATEHPLSFILAPKL